MRQRFTRKQLRPKMATMHRMGEAAGHGWPVALRNVSRTFPGGIRAVDDVSLDVLAGQFLALLGPSGCGKSTLLRMIAGLDRGDGTIDTGCATRGSRGEGIAYVFQDPHLLPWRTVLDNAALPLELRGRPKQQRREQAAAVLEQVGLGEFLNRYPAQLSGGMRMRVSVARALVTDPQLLLLDEPFAALDEITRQRLDEMLRALWLERGMTVLFVTHSIAEAVFLAERAVVFSRRPARVVLDQTIDLPRDRSAELRTEAVFAGQMRDLQRALEGSE